MGKKPSAKRDKAAAKEAQRAEREGTAEEEEYEFDMPDFDEKAFMRREIESARMTFWTAAFALPIGVAAWAVGAMAPDWRVGFLPVIGALWALGPLLKRMGYSDENTAPKAMFGNWFLMFFTALVVWIVAVNV